MTPTAHDRGKFSGTDPSAAAKTLSPAVTPKRWIIGKVGEWMQGVDSEGAPIVYALTVGSSPFRTLTSVEPASSLAVTINPGAPAESAKVQKAIKELAIGYGLTADCTYRVTITGSPPRGKGLGSSSIDIASVLLAIKELHSCEISNSEMFKLMCRVERSDYLFDPDLIVAANPRDGSCAMVAHAPKCLVLAWDTDPGTVVETESVPHLDLARRCFSEEYRELSTMIESGITENLLNAAIRSAELNNRILPKIGFSVARKLVRELRNVGLIAAHTGTMLGFALPQPVDKDMQRYIWEFVVDRYLVAPMVFEVGGPRSQEGLRWSDGVME
jgi:L-threonine kinase